MTAVMGLDPFAEEYESICILTSIVTIFLKFISNNFK
jgi:hypothetical protein